jgi:hypothetical protein
MTLARRWLPVGRLIPWLLLGYVLLRRRVLKRRRSAGALVLGGWLLPSLLGRRISARARAAAAQGQRQLYSTFLEKVQVRGCFVSAGRAPVGAELHMTACACGAGAGAGVCAWHHPWRPQAGEVAKVLLAPEALSYTTKGGLTFITDRFSDGTLLPLLTAQGVAFGAAPKAGVKRLAPYLVMLVPFIYLGLAAWMMRSARPQCP